MTSVEVAELTGKAHKEIMRSIRRMEPAWQQVNGRNFALVEYCDSKGEMRPCYELDYKECMYIASKFNDITRAKLVLRWEALETGKVESLSTIRNTEATEVHEKLSFKDKMWYVKEVQKMLNLSDASTMKMMGEIVKPFGLPMPEYTPSHGILKSATELLKDNDFSISAQVFNKKAMECGYLCDMTRKSSHGEKHFKSITKKGKGYGENQISPNNPKETQPLWYADKFISLMANIGLR